MALAAGKSIWEEYKEFPNGFFPYPSIGLVLPGPPQVSQGLPRRPSQRPKVALAAGRSILEVHKDFCFSLRIFSPTPRLG